MYNSNTTIFRERLKREKQQLETDLEYSSSMPLRQKKYLEEKLSLVKKWLK